MQVDELVRFFETLSPGSLARFPDFYAEDAWFKDPFNEVQGVAAIQRIFRHMFTQVAEPRFRVVDRVADGNGLVLVWEFHFRWSGFWRRGRAEVLRGVSHLRFDARDTVIYHRGYWDAAEELYMKLPGLGWLLGGLRRRLAA